MLVETLVLGRQDCPTHDFRHFLDAANLGRVTQLLQDNAVLERQHGNQILTIAQHDFRQANLAGVPQDLAQQRVGFFGDGAVRAGIVGRVEKRRRNL